MGRQLADLWRRNRDSAPPDEFDEPLPDLELPPGSDSEHSLPLRFNVLALLSAIRLRLLAFHRTDLPRPICRYLQLYESQAEAHAQKRAFLPRQGCSLLLAFHGH